MSAQAQHIAKVCGAYDYFMTEMEAVAVAQVIQRTPVRAARCMTVR